MPRYPFCEEENAKGEDDARAGEERGEGCARIDVAHQQADEGVSHESIGDKDQPDDRID
ncbi:MAG: hypothetical protein GWN58_11725, partial [Anaerolineae bacterium]|nr:hypothetical protein [Anaerolineae bacterium]